MVCCHELKDGNFPTSASSQPKSLPMAISQSCPSHLQPELCFHSLLFRCHALKKGDTDSPLKEIGDTEEKSDTIPDIKGLMMQRAGSGI